MSLGSKIEAIAEDVIELKIISAKQNIILERLTESVEHHVKRCDILEDLNAMVREEQLKLKAEHDLTKSLLEANIAAQEAKANAKADLMWNTLKTILLTLCGVGSLLLALHELGILKKLF